MAHPKSNWFKHVLTDYDNKTYDTGRVLAFGYFICSVIFEAVGMWKGQTFDIQAYLLGGGTFLSGLGLYLFGDGKGRELGGMSNVDVSTTIPKE